MGGRRQWHPFDEHIVILFLEAKKGQFKNTDEATRSLRAHLLDTRRKYGINTSEADFTFQRVYNKICNVARRQCEKKMAICDLLEKGSIACGIAIPELTEELLALHIADLRSDMNTQDRTARMEEAPPAAHSGTVGMVFDDQQLPMRKAFRIAQAKFTRASLADEVSEHGNEGPISNNEICEATAWYATIPTEMDTLFRAIQEASHRVAHTSPVPISDVDSRLSRIEEELTVAVQRFTEDMQVRRICFDKLSQTETDKCEGLVPAHGDEVRRLLGHCQGKDGISNMHMLMALIGSTMHAMFQGFRIGQDCARIGNLEQMASYFGPGGGTLRSILKALDEQESLDKLKNDKDSLRRFCKSLTTDVVRMVFDICDFEKTCSVQDFRDSVKNGWDFEDALIDIFLEARELRIDLAKFEGRYGFFLCEYGSKYDSRRMQRAPEATGTPSVVKISVMMGVVDSFKKRVIRKATVLA